MFLGFSIHGAKFSAKAEVNILTPASFKANTRVFFFAGAASTQLITFNGCACKNANSPLYVLSSFFFVQSSLYSHFSDSRQRKLRFFSFLWHVFFWELKGCFRGLKCGCMRRWHGDGVLCMGEWCSVCSFGWRDNRRVLFENNAFY